MPRKKDPPLVDDQTDHPSEILQHMRVADVHDIGLCEQPVVSNEPQATSRFGACGGEPVDRDVVAVFTWEDLQRPFIAAVEKEKMLVTFLFGLISMVAILLVGCIFYMIVEKKTRDIGVLKSLGASGRGVAVLFIVYAGAVGVVGAVLGVLLGSAFVWNINDIQDLLVWMNPALRVWDPSVYTFDRIPEIVNEADAFWIGVVAVVASMFGSLIPAILAGRVWPVRALRYE